MNLSPQKPTSTSPSPQSTVPWTVLQNSSFGYLLLDQDGRVCETNPAFSSAVQFPPEQLAQKTLPEVLPELAHQLEPVLNKLLAEKVNEQSYSLEVTLPRSMYHSRTWKATCLYISPNDRPPAIAVQLEETTNLSSMETMLFESENRFRSTFDSATTGMALVDLSGNLFRVNRALCRMLAYEEHELVGQSITSLTCPDDLAEDLVESKRLFEGEINHYQLEKRYLRSDGQIVWGHLNASIVRGVDGSPLYGVGEVQDITGRKIAFDAMLKSEQQYRNLADSIPQLVWIADKEGTIQYVNDQAVKYIGQDQLSRLWPNWEPLVHPDDLAETSRQWSQSVTSQTAIDIQFRFRRFDGEYRWHISRAVPVFSERGKIDRWFGTLTDIHDQKLLQQALDASERKFRAVLEQSFDCVKLTTAEGIVKYISPSSEELLGYKPEERLGKLAFESIHPDDKDFVREQMRQVLASPGEPLTWAYRARHRNGTTRWLEVWVTNLLDDQDVESVVINIRDVTNDKLNSATQERLRAERNRLLHRLQIQVETMPIGLIVTDEEFCIIEWNPAAQKIFGHLQEDVLAKRFDQLGLVDQSSMETVEEIAQNLLKGGDTVHGTHRNRTSSGKEILCEWYLTPLIDEGGKFEGVLSSVIDVTDRRQLEEQFRQAQKMEAVGRLAGGIAHDFNNLLTVINGYTELLLDESPDVELGRSLLLEIQKAGIRAARLTDQLLSFSRKKVQKSELLCLVDVTRNMESMLRRLIGEDVELVVEYENYLPRVLADQTQIEQILMNLSVNARDAMPRGGRLSIAIGSMVILDAEEYREFRLQPGKYVRITVTDNGTGMTDEVRKQVFEPFFTTKEAGDGTGLGLSTVYGVIAQHGGNVRVHSVLGEGTRFDIVLPAALSPPSAISPSHNDQPAGNGERILLVEDDQTLRNVIQQMLDQLGYQVVSAGSAQEAMKLARERQVLPDLLLTDVVMPEVGGADLFKNLVQRLPELKVLFMSGYANEQLLQYGVDGTDEHFLQKPFSRSTLAQQVYHTLN